MTALGNSRGTTVEVNTTPLVSQVAPSPTPKVGGAGQFLVILDTQVAADTVITLTQTNPAALTLPASLIVPANRSNGSTGIIGLANALTTVTATLGASNAMTNITPTP